MKLKDTNHLSNVAISTSVTRLGVPDQLDIHHLVKYKDIMCCNHTRNNDLPIGPSSPPLPPPGHSLKKVSACQSPG